MIVIIILIIILLLYFLNNSLKKNIKKNSIIENFRNIDYKDNNKENKIIWTYWETIKGKKKPGYIDLCINSIKYNCEKCFQVIVLDNHTIYNYLPEIKDINLSKLNIPQKVDFYRYNLLEKYGGVWIDADILVIKCICPFYNKLNKHNDYVGFGCGFDLKTCQKTFNGYSRPLNWFMMSKKNTNFMKCIQKKALQKINHYNNSNQKIEYHGIGKDILHECYNELNKKNNWTYTHIDSKCQEFDTQGNKLNNILIDFNWKDCYHERIFFPLYNTAPGYPDWFKNLSEKELKTKNTYLKPLILQAFNPKEKCQTTLY